LKSTTLGGETLSDLSAVAHSGRGVIPGRLGCGGEFSRPFEFGRCLAHGDLAAFVQQNLAVHSLSAHVGAIEAAEIAKNELRSTELDQAVLFRDDLVEQLDRIVGVTT